MTIQLVTGESMEFEELELIFSESGIDNKFKEYTRKSLRRTLNSQKYTPLRQLFSNEYNANLDVDLGTFLHKLKENKDQNYLYFLNQNGDKQFCRFKFENRDYEKKKGLYCYEINGEIKYVGRCTDNFNKRINNGYGNISPKNCYKDGQSTNCRINSLLNKAIINKEEVKSYIHSIDDIDEIKLKEKILLQNRYDWNIL